MKKLLFFIIMLGFQTELMAQQTIELGDGLTLTIPEGISQLNDTPFLYAGADSSCFLAIKTLQKQDYDRDKVKDKLDRLVFNLKDFDQTDSKTDGLLESGKDYRQNFYVSRSGVKITTFTTYVYEYPYCILLQYKSDADLEKLQAVVSSEHYDSSWGHMIWTFCSRSLGLIFLTYFVVTIICAIVQKWWFGLLFGLAVSAWVCAPVWGVWSVWLPLVALGVIFSLAGSTMSIEEVGNAIINGMS